MNWLKYLLLLIMALVALFTPCKIQAQQSWEMLSLHDAIQMAREQSVSAILAETNKETSYWEFRTYRSGLYPQLALKGTLPDFSRAISSVTQPDGTLIFQPIVNNNSGLNLELSQNIGLTGGQMFVSSQLQRFDDLDRNVTRYNSNPVSVGFVQPLFNFNRFRWDRQIEPLRLERSERKYLTDLEAVSLQATAHYFTLLLAQMDYEMARQNVESGQKNLDIAKVRYKMGRISENDILQINYSLLNAKRALQQARQDMYTAFLQLKSFVGLQGGQVQVKEPDHLPVLQVSEELALAEAHKNKETVVDFEIRLLEARRNVNRARMEGGLNADLFAAVGLANRANQLGELYTNPVDQQMFRIGFTLPIVDWGRNKAVQKTAQANQKLVDYTVRQDEADFEQQIITQVALIQSLRSQVEVAQEAAHLARQRFTITGESFSLGRISITELTIAQNEKDQAYRNYMQALQNYWQTYYRIRMLTLYDFETGQPIQAPL
jgi:outer membrane protein TolC